jgi:hypothetical protein
LNASYLSEGARKASFLSQEICHFEPGRITAVIQPTDADVAFSYKALTNVESNRLKRELRDKAIEQNTQAVYRCGPYEVLRVVYQAHIKLQQQEVESQALLACFRRKGFLAYRPDFEKGCLVPFEDDKLPMGSHRYPKAWLEHRLSWRDEHGVPVEACWDKRCGAGVEAIEDMMDHTQHGDPKCQVKMACQPHALIKEVHLSLSGHVNISAELPDALPHSVELACKVRSRRIRAFDEHLSNQAVKNPGKNKERQKIKDAYKIVLPKWRQEQRELGLSRKQLLSVLIPVTGDRDKKRKVIEEGSKVAGMHKLLGNIARKTEQAWCFGWI